MYTRMSNQKAQCTVSEAGLITCTGGGAPDAQLRLGATEPPAGAPNAGGAVCAATGPRAGLLAELPCSTPPCTCCAASSVAFLACALLCLRPGARRGFKLSWMWWQSSLGQKCTCPLRSAHKALNRPCHW